MLSGRRDKVMIMIRNPFGIHFIPTHQSQAHYDFIRAARPDVVKLVSGNGAPDVQMMAQMYECAPDAIHIYRNWPLSEQQDDLWRDPVGTAVRHVSNWQNDMRVRRDEAARRGLALPPQEQTMTLGINEPVTELFPRNEDMSNYGEWLAMMQQRTPILDNYMSAYVWESKKYGLPCGIGNFSGGQPANLKPGGFATYDWFPKTRHALETNRGFASLVTHEYWDLPGPGEMVNWWTYRFFNCDWDTDIYVLECGIDRAIRSEEYEGNRGWFGHMTPQQYAGQMGEYIRHCRQDSRFKAATPFTLDGDKMWWSFWLDNCMAEMVALSDQLQRESKPTPTTPETPAAVPHTVYIPSVTQPGPTPPTAEQPQPSAPIETHLPFGVIDPYVAEAVMQVESGNQGFNADGSLKIRTEAHLLLNPAYGNPAVMGTRFRSEPGDYLHGWLLLGGEWVEYHAQGQAGEWAALNLAMSLDRDAALRCTSFGSSQVLGINHAKIGYATPEAMYQAFSRSANVHALGFVNYCLATPGLVGAINARDFERVGELYNGAASAGELYRAAYEQLVG